MTSSYDQYANFVGEICALNDLSFFKAHKDFVYMLEHVTPDQGQQYLDVILRVTHLSEKDIKEFCELNDSLGRPRTGTYSFGTVSPTNLRYILQAHLILTHIYNHSLKNPDIIEQLFTPKIVNSATIDRFTLSLKRKSQNFFKYPCQFIKHITLKKMVL